MTGHEYAILSTEDSPEHDSVPSIRRALHQLPSRLGADLPGEPHTVQGLADQVTEAWRIYEQDTIRYAVVGERLSGLLAEAHYTIRSSTGEAELYATHQLIRLYHLFQVFHHRIGERSLAQLVADRAMALSDATNDPTLIAASVWNVCSALTAAGHVQESVDLARSTIDRYPLSGDATPEHISVIGALHLAVVIASVRVGDAVVAWDLLRRADELAVRLGSRLHV